MAQGLLFDAVTRVACVHVPALSLQLALRAHPEWRHDPVVIVEDDRPLAAIVHCNRAARALRIERGMSFSQAKALSATLHAEVSSEPALAEAIDALFTLLLAFSPHIEPVLLQPGLFWLDPNGLDPLFGNLERWAARIHEKLEQERYFSTVVVGFTRGATWSIANLRTGPWVIPSREQEIQKSADVPIARLGISSALIEQLALLDIRRIGELLALPVSQLRKRYGAEAAQLHDFLSGKTWSPLLPRAPITPLCVTLDVDPPDDDHLRLLFGLKALLHGVVDRLATAHGAVTALVLRFELERLGEHHERIESAAPTLDVPQLVDLLRLRLSTVALSARVERIVVTVEHTRLHPLQIAILHGPKPRDLDAAARAIARLRASFGSEVVTYAQLRSAHLPEASFRFEPTRVLRLPRSMTLTADPPLVRRMYMGTVLDSCIVPQTVPIRIAGGWWSPRGARYRDYYFIETQTGELLWVFYDRPRGQWRLQGLVD